MVKKLILSLLLIVGLNSYGFSYSARSEVHKFGFTSLGDDISTISYNPAGIFYLPKTYAELGATSDENFKYNQLAVGYYLTRFPFLSRIYWTSMNLALGMTKIDDKEEYSIGLGGTLIDFIKYGFLLKYDKVEDEKYTGFNTGLIINIAKWCKLGFVAMNLENKDKSPLNFNTGINFIIIPELKLTFGLNLDKGFKEILDYSSAVDINLIKNFYLLGGVQKNIIPVGLGFAFSLEQYKNSKKSMKVRSCYREKIFVTFDYNKQVKKFTKIIVSFNYRFHSFIHSPYIIPEGVSSKGNIRESYIDEEEKVLTDKDVLNEQKERLNRAESYFAGDRWKDAIFEIEKILELDRDTDYAKDALKLKSKIEKLEKKLRRLKK